MVEYNHREDGLKMGIYWWRLVDHNHWLLLMYQNDVDMVNSLSLYVR